MESTGKQIVFVVCLLGFFFTLVMTMPGEFYVVAPGYDETEYETYWDIGDIKTVYATDASNMTYEDYDAIEFTIGGKVETFHVRGWWINYAGTRQFEFWHWNWGFLGLGSGDIDPHPLLESVVNASVDESGNFSRFLMSCDHHSYIVYIGNNGTYASLSDALDAGYVGVSIGVDYDYEGSVLSGSDLLTRLLTLQLPGVRSEIAFLIGIPIYTLIGFLAFVIITMVVDMFPLT